MKNLLQNAKYPLAGAVFMLAAFPGFSLWLMAWVAIIPMLMHAERCRTRQGAFLSGFSTGVLFFAGLLYWLPAAINRYGDIPLAGAAGVFAAACAVLAVFFGLFTLAMQRMYRRLGIRAVFLAPFVWTALEFARNHLAVTGFPWGLLGVSQAMVTPLLQIADITGIYGVSFLVATGNVTLFVLLRRDAPRKMKTALVAFEALLLFHVFLYAELRWFAFRDDPGQPVSVAGLQGNVADADGWLDAHWKVYPAMMGGLKTVAPAARVVIMPENPSSLALERDPEYRKLMAGLAAGSRATLIFNGIHGIGADGYGNAVFCMDSTGAVRSVYDKIRLVPFAEHVPFRSVFFFAGAMSQEISNFTPGERHVLHLVDGAPVGVFICYEAIFPEEPRAFTALGAQWLVNITNDAWFGPTAAPWQHFQNILARAVENRRWIVRVANTGFSCIVDPLGRVREAVPPFERGVLRGEIRALTGQSAYVVIGDLFAWACALLSAFYLVWPRRREPLPPPQPYVAEDAEPEGEDEGAAEEGEDADGSGPPGPGPESGSGEPAQPRSSEQG